MIANMDTNTAIINPNHLKNINNSFVPGNFIDVSTVVFIISTVSDCSVTMAFLICKFFEQDIKDKSNIKIINSLFMINW